MSATAGERDAEPSAEGPDLKGFLLVLRRALRMVLAYIDETCEVGEAKRPR